MSTRKAASPAVVRRGRRTTTERPNPRRRTRRSEALAFLEKLSGGPLTLAKLLRSIREGEEMTQAVFAETLGISKQHLSHIENGRKVVSPERAARWAAALGYAESQFVRLALQDELDRAGLRYSVTVDAA
jgi:DNA-binding XRE family transcriptional regulator